MKLFYLVVLLGACGIEEPPDENQIESAATDTQGTDYQGTDYQGTDYQGTDYQGTDYQGTDYQGTDYQGTAYAQVSISGSSIVAWKQLADLTWEQRTPNKICHWNAAKNVVLEPCTVVDLSITPSPLAGTLWPARFTKLVNGHKTVITGTIRIGLSVSDVNAVSVDTSTAMHPLDGTAAANCQPQPTTCSNPRGCRRNCDLYTYALYLLDDAGEVPFCKGTTRAYALSGTWSSVGKYSSSTSRFTFACANGTIAKCTRWGYRPFGMSRRSDGVSVAMAEYHQACVRAATADYCANGHSFTKNGTLVDIFDYNGLGDVGNVGFVPATSTGAITNNTFLWESTFDKYGATWLDHTRYEETSADLENTAIGCPTRWWQNGSDDVGANYNRREEYGTIQPIKIAISNTTSCAHSEQTVGKWLDRRCNRPCIDIVAAARPYCVDPHDSRGWNQGCVDLAAVKCKVAYGTQPMAYHSECTTGSALTKYDSACTLAVCSQNPACCNNSYLGWNSTCTSLANSMCKNGRESVFNGFCSTVVVLPPIGFATNEP